MIPAKDIIAYSSRVSLIVPMLPSALRRVNASLGHLTHTSLLTTGLLFAVTGKHCYRIFGRSSIPSNLGYSIISKISGYELERVTTTIKNLCCDGRSKNFLAGVNSMNYQSPSPIKGTKLPDSTGV
jgi:hypothetical protein